MGITSTISSTRSTEIKLPWEYAGRRLSDCLSRFRKHAHGQESSARKQVIWTPGYMQNVQRLFYFTNNQARAAATSIDCRNLRTTTEIGKAMMSVCGRVRG
eukprot:scpid12087/ scgid12949/ 